MADRVRRVVRQTKARIFGGLTFRDSVRIAQNLSRHVEQFPVLSFALFFSFRFKAYRKDEGKDM